MSIQTTYLGPEDDLGGAFQTVTGLVGAYTYSDMTGFALSNVSQ